MTPDPNSPVFIQHHIPKDVPEYIKQFEDIYSLLRTNIEALVWQPINDNDISLEYNTYTAVATIEIRLTDKNAHTHRLRLVGQTNCACGEEVHCEYEHEGVFDEPVIFYRSYVEWLMLELWREGFEASLCNCDKGLEINCEPKDGSKLMSFLLDTVTSNIKPIEWFLSDEPIWQFYTTYNDLRLILVKLQDEAGNDRWKGVKPENFILTRAENHAVIYLEYSDDINYKMRFRLGLTKTSFAANAPDKFMDMSYSFESISNNSEVKEYYDNENVEFCKTANVVMDLLTTWKALHFYGENNVYINTYRKHAFQKFCLLLDCLLSLKDGHEAKKLLITSDIRKKKEKLEAILGTEMIITEDEDDKHIFANGHFYSDQIIIDEDIDCPF